MSKITWFPMACVFLGLCLSANAQQLVSNNRSEFSVDSTSLELGAKSLFCDFLQSLPFRGEPQDYYQLFSGAIQQDYRGINLLHIRGSRHDEIAYTFEGADTRSAITGRNVIRFIPEALESISLLSSPTASVSHAAALLQHRLRRGGGHFKLSLRGETDRFTPYYQMRFDTYSYGYFNYLLTAEGKIFKDNIRFFAAGESELFADHYRKFWEGFRIGGPDFPLVDRYSQQSLQEITGADAIVVRPGNIPNASSRRYTFNGVITGELKPLTWRAIGAWNWEKSQQNDTPVRNLFDPMRIPEHKQHSGLLSLQTDYAGPEDLHGHVQVDFLQFQDKIYDPLFEDNFLLYRDSLAIVAKGVNWSAPHSRYWDGPGQAEFYEFRFSRPGDLLTSYAKSKESALSLSGTVTKKLGDHQLLFGGDWQRRTWRVFEIRSLSRYMRALHDFNPDNREVKLLWLKRDGFVDAFGYDVFGNEIAKTDEVNDAPRHPTAYAFYWEDRYRVRNLQLNVGLRYQAFASNALFWRNPRAPEFSSDPIYHFVYIPPSALRTARSHHYFLPRLNWALFVNNRMGVHFDFGKYVQQAQLSEVYASRSYLYWLHNIDGHMYELHGPEAAPIKTTQSVVGISYRVQPNFDFRASLFYKTTDGQLASTLSTSEYGPAISYPPYPLLANRGETTAKGVELVSYYHYKGFHTWINYALSDVEGMTSYPLSNRWEIGDFIGSEITDDRLSPLEYSQKHRGNVMMSYQFDATPPRWLQKVGFSMLFRFNSGHDFTIYEGPFGQSAPETGSLLSDRDSFYRTGEIGQITTPWNYQFDLKLTRALTLGGIALQAYAYVQNAFNRKNVLNVYWRTGITTIDGSFDINPGDKEIFRQMYGERFFVLYDLINIHHRQHYQIRQGGDLFGRPREIRFGLQLNFGV